MKKTLTEQIVHIQNDLDVVFDGVVKLEKKLAIATKALEEINKNYRFTVAQDVVYKALKEMKGVK